MVSVIALGHEFGLVEQREQVAARLKIGTDIEKTTRLVDALCVVDHRIPGAENQVAGVLGFFSLAGLRIEIGLKGRVDVGDFHAVEMERGEVLSQPVVTFPVVSVGGT